MYSSLPYFASYATAFTETSVAGFAGIALQKVKDDWNAYYETHHLACIYKLGAMALGSLKKALQVSAGVDMAQAAFLSAGYSPMGFLGHTFVIWTISPAIEIATHFANKHQAPQPVRMLLNALNEHLGTAGMVAALVSALVIAKVIGFFHLLPLAIASSAAYLLYKSYLYLKVQVHHAELAKT